MPLSKNVKIEECNEKLELLDEKEFVLEPMYLKWGHNKTPEMKLREGVIEKLRQAKRMLRMIEGCEAWNIKIWDGYRTLHTQKLLYDGYYVRLKLENPDWDHNKLCKAVEIFISPPSHDKALPSPHNTGGSVDLTLVDGDKAEIDMGTPFDEFTERAFTMHFKKDGNNVHANRMLLKSIMEGAGFTNYPEEWWHFDFGNPLWAETTGKMVAMYGSAEL